MNITIDIECVPSQDPELFAEIQTRHANEARVLVESIKPPGNYKSQESIQKWWEETGNLKVKEASEGWQAKADDEYRGTVFDGLLGQIVAIAYAIDDRDPVILYVDDWRNGEASLIREFFSGLSSELDGHKGHGGYPKPVFIGHNLIDFDLKYIHQRSIINGIKPPQFIPFKAKPWDESVFDTMTQWDAKKRVSMDRLCKAFGIQCKGDLDGSKVWDYVQAGRIAEVAEYCKDDVIRTREIFKRMTFK